MMSCMTSEFIFVVAGSAYRNRTLICTAARAAIGSEVVLEREPDNRCDPNAIKCWIGGVWIGYVPKVTAAILAPVLDEGKLARACLRVVLFDQRCGRDPIRFEVLVHT